MKAPVVIAHVSLACWPGLRHDLAAQQLLQDLFEPLFGRLSTAHVQLVPQSFGVLTEAAADGLLAAFPDSRFMQKTHFDDGGVFDQIYTPGGK